MTISSATPRPDDRAAAVRANLYAFFRALERVPSCEYLAGPDYIRWRTPIPHPWFSGVLCASETDADRPTLIRDTVAYFQANRVPGFTWWFEQEVSIAHWREDLAAADLHFDNSTPGMALELADLADAPDTPAGLAIRRVTDPDAFRVWCDAFTAGYELPADWAPLIFDGMAPMGFDDPLTHYLGMVDGIPVATASMMLAAGAAGIYNVSTFAPYRGRGIGAAVTTAPLVEARDHGYTTGVLQSSEMGYSVYARMGFVTVCQMEHFYWLAG